MKRRTILTLMLLVLAIGVLVGGMFLIRQSATQGPNVAATYFATMETRTP